MKYHKIQDPSESVSDAAASPAEAAAEDPDTRGVGVFLTQNRSHISVSS